MSAAETATTPAIQSEGAAVHTAGDQAAANATSNAAQAEGKNPRPNRFAFVVHHIDLSAGRRLYIGNLAYATTEGELKTFFKEFLVYVHVRSPLVADDTDSDASESVSIPVNPRTTRPVGYAFVDLSTPSEAERAIAELNGQTILERKVSIQLARKPETHAEGATSGGEGTSGNETRRRGSHRGRGRGRGRGGRAHRGGRAVSDCTVLDDSLANMLV
jgi:RNA recognition motif-containing protein